MIYTTLDYFLITFLEELICKPWHAINVGDFILVDAISMGSPVLSSHSIAFDLLSNTENGPFFAFEIPDAP